MKKYYLFIMLLLFTQCDYKPIYSKNNQNFGIKILEFNENRSNKILATRLESFSYEKDKIFLYELKLLTSENWAKECLSLPLYPYMKLKDANKVVRLIRKFYS